MAKDYAGWGEEDLLCDVGYIEAQRGERDLTAQELEELEALYTALDAVRG